VTRRLLNLLTLLSLLLCVAVCVLWVRSWARFDHLRWRYGVHVTPEERNERSLHAVSIRGRFMFARSLEQYTPYPPWMGWRRPIPRTGVTLVTSMDRPGWANFELELYESTYQFPLRRPLGLATLDYWSLTNHGGPISRFSGVVVPHGLVALALALPPLGSAIKLCRARPRPGHCRQCGYDLTGNVTGLCPECGANQAPAPASV
jgi:hypothetical protein